MSPFNIHDEIKLNLNEQTILIKTEASKIVYKEPSLHQLLSWNLTLNLLMMS